MSREEFLEFLKLKNFPEPVLVEQPANGSLDVHTHDFEVFALVSEGSIAITSCEIEMVYKQGQVFHLPFRQPHTERYGVDGVKYLASRKMHSA